MSMRKCPKCGEVYSDTYKTCPFCEEDEALAEGRSLRRRNGGRRVARRREPTILGPVMILVILLLAGILIYFFFGDSIADRLGFGRENEPPSSSQEAEPPSLGEDDLLNPNSGAPVIGTDDPSVPDDGTTAPAGTDPENLPETLKLSNPDFTLFKKGETTTLTVSGGSGPFTWVSSDENVVTVSSDGVVTAVGDGKATLTVYNSSAKAIGTVYVRGAGTAAGSGGTGANGVPISTGNPSLNNTDFTIRVGGTPVQMKVLDSGSAVTWSSENPAVASISASGVVNGVSVGTTNVVAAVDGKTLKCIVRVVS